MKRLGILAFALTISICGFAQRQAQQKIESAKIALITERLNLTPEQAEKFWPVYNEYTRKMRTIRMEFDEARKKHNPETATDEENKRILDLGHKAKERSLDLEKQYSERLLQTIDNRQMISLKKAESDFKMMILKRLRDQKQRRDQLRDRQRDGQDMQRRRNN